MNINITRNKTDVVKFILYVQEVLLIFIQWVVVYEKVQYFIDRVYVQEVLLIFTSWVVPKLDKTSWTYSNKNSIVQFKVYICLLRARERERESEWMREITSIIFIAPSCFIQQAWPPWYLYKMVTIRIYCARKKAIGLFGEKIFDLWLPSI